LLLLLDSFCHFKRLTAAAATNSHTHTRTPIAVFIHANDGIETAQQSVIKSPWK